MAPEGAAATAEADAEDSAGASSYILLAPTIPRAGPTKAPDAGGEERGASENISTGGREGRERPVLEPGLFSVLTDEEEMYRHSLEPGRDLRAVAKSRRRGQMGGETGDVGVFERL